MLGAHVSRARLAGVLLSSIVNEIATLAAALSDRYEITREIGAGGMATVYLARDLKHDRQVAVKVLRPELGAVLGVERFLAEIKVTANLQHPNLLPLFDSGEASGLLFYVMPYVEGESLRARLDRETQLAVDDAVQIATAVANALDYAHSHGVIHRDLKPENVLIQAGQPVIADFGIALAVSKAGGARVTQTGLSLGTPQYMSPEQATGDRTLDGRTDIYSLGALTYEMLTGEPPHTGKSAQSIIAKLMTEEVRPLTVLRRNVPPHVDAAVRRALEKLPADRFATAHEFRDALHARGATPASSTYSAASAREPDRHRTSTTGRFLASPAMTAAGFVLAGVVGAVWWTGARARPQAVPVHFAFSVAPSQPIGVTLGQTVAMSPDGKTIVYSTSDSSNRSRIFVRELDDLTQRALSGSEGATWPFFSWDGRSLGFLEGSQLKRLPLDGGAPTLLADVRFGIQGATWTPAGVVFSADGKLMLVPSGGGMPVLLAGSDSAAAFFPVALPSGKAVLYASQLGSNGPLGVASIPDGKMTLLDVQGVFPLGVIDEDLLYVRDDGAVVAVPFDSRRLRVTGSAVVIVSDVAVNPTGFSKAALSRDGSLAYVSGSATMQLVLADSRGVVKPLAIPAGQMNNPRFSPDGRRVALDMKTSGRTDIWIYELASGASRRLTSDARPSMRPEWTTDGNRIVFRSLRSGSRGTLWWQPGDGSDAAELLINVSPKDVYEGMISPDGRTVLYRTGTSGTADIWYRSLKGDTATKGVATSPFTENAGRLSPDGHWIAFASNESGRNEVYVRSFPGSGATVPVSVNGASTPVWSPDGRKIFYAEGQKFIAASVVTTPTFAVSSREVLFEGSFLFGLGHATFDVARDGKSFLMLRPVAGSEEQVVVVHNFMTELRARRRSQAASR